CKYRPDVRPQGTELGDRNQQTTERAFYLKEPMVIELVFERPAKLKGRITNKQGQPLANAKVQLGFIHNLRTRNGLGTWSCSFLGNESQPISTPVRFDAIRLLPAKFRETHTNAQGYYEFTQLRRDTSYLANIDPGPTFDPWHFTLATTVEENVRDNRTVAVGYDGELNHEFEAPRSVSVQVADEKTQQPVANVLVTAHPVGQLRRAGIQARSDSQGNARLQLLPGEYKLIAEPAPDLPFYFQSEQFVVSDKTGDVEHTLKLRPAAIVILKAVNAQTGEPIPGISFNYETGSSDQQLPVSTQTVFVDYPQTNAAGELQAFVVPGMKRFVVADPLALAQADDSRGELLKLTGGKVTEVRFELTPPQFLPSHLAEKEFKPDPNHVYPPELQIKWHAQSELLKTTPLRVTTSMLILSRKPVNTRALLEELRALRPDQIPDFDQLLTKHKAGKLNWNKLILTSDGTRFREDRYYSYSPLIAQHFDFEGQPVPPSVNLFNGWDSLRYGIGNNQANAYQGRRRGIHLATVRDLCEWPYVRRVGRTASGQPDLEKPDVKTVKSKNKTTYDVPSKTRISRCVIDNQTGCVLETSYGENLDDPDRLDLYFAPTEYPGGIILPRAHLTWSRYRGKLRLLQAYLVEKVEVFSHLPADALAVSLPAGAMLVDYRGLSVDAARSGRIRPKQHIFNAPITDFAAYLQRHPATLPKQESLIEYGKPAPELKPAKWLTVKGESPPPDLKGKVVLIEFWGTRCGPCLAKLPEVRTVARFYADHPFVLIGMHDSYASVSELQKFAEKEEIEYQLAIDKPSTEKGWFGQTMREFGVRGIPKAAVIDQQGNVAFVGYFEEALRTVDRLLKQKK
ncbi:MAG: TlpA disulfide reductase family protein, partial [Planctomycetota bacterium]